MTFRGPLQPCPFCDFNDSVLLWTDEFCISEDYSFAYFLNTVLTSKNAHFKYRRIKQLKRIIFSKTLIYQNLYTDILYRILEYCKHTYKNKQSFFFFLVLLYLIFPALFHWLVFYHAVSWMYRNISKWQNDICSKSSEQQLVLFVLKATVSLYMWYRVTLCRHSICHRYDICSS